MTLAMPDSTDVAALPSGYGQYLGYVDGAWPTYPELVRKFPQARNIGLTVTGQTFAAHGCDIEPGNLTAKDGAQWARQKLNRQPASRPVLYASVIGEPGYGMPWVLEALAVNGISRDRVRLLSAHYGLGEHICGHRTCGAVSVTMDGTQWTDAFYGFNEQRIDMSALADGFFGSWTEEIVRQLPVVQRGDSGEAVRTVQGALLARGVNIGDSGPKKDGLDGVYGALTESGVAWIQGHATPAISVDGIVGPETWPPLLGIA